MSEDVKVKIDLDLDDSKAKEKLEQFKSDAKGKDIKVKLDFSDIKSDTNKIKNGIKDAFKISGTGGLDKIERKLNDINKVIKNSGNLNKNISSGIDNSVKEYLSVVKKIESLNAELHKASTNNESKVISALKDEMQLYQRKQLEIASTIRANGNLSDSVKKLISQEEKLAQARTKTRDSKTDTSYIKQQESELGKLLGQLDKYHNKLNDIERSLSNMKKSKGFLDNNLLEKTNNILRRTRESLNANGIESDFNQINNSISKISNNMKDLKFGNTLSKQEASFNASYNNMQQRVERFASSIKGMKGSEDIIQRIVHDFNGINTTNIERASVELKQFGSNLKKAGNEIKELNGGGLFGKFSKDFKENLFTFTAGDLLADGIRSITSSIKDTILDLDSAYTDLNKILNKPLSANGLKEMSREATRIARDVGQSSGDVIRATADIAQLAGIEDINKARSVAEQTMKLVNVTGMSQEEASKGVATLISSFKKEIDIGKKVTIGQGKNKKSVDQLTNAFDKLNFVG